MLAELEFLYVYALNSPKFAVGQGQPFFQLMCEYIDGFFEKNDVVSDLKPYFTLLNVVDSNALHKRFTERVKQIEQLEKEARESNPSNAHLDSDTLARQTMVQLKTIRWNLVLHKMNRLLGIY